MEHNKCNQHDCYDCYNSNNECNSYHHKRNNKCHSCNHYKSSIIIEVTKKDTLTAKNIRFL